MKNFFATLFTWNKANAGKFIVGAAAGVLASAAFISFPPAVLAASTIIVTIASTLGLHAIHLAEPPQLPVGKR